MNPLNHGLGRRVPSDWKHVEKHPLRAEQLETLPPVPVVLGINWYSNFDNPEYIDGQWWIGRGGLGYVRGGHAICARPYPITDLVKWWEFYEQWDDDCVGYACSRMMSLFNRAKYDAPWLYDEAQLIDEWDDTPPEGGTSVRAGCDVLRLQGHRKITANWEAPYPVLKGGIASNSWATSWDQVRKALQLPSGNHGVPLLNSWGRSYPHVVRITDEAGARLLDEDGEAAIPVDRVA